MNSRFMFLTPSKTSLQQEIAQLGARQGRLHVPVPGTYRLFIDETFIVTFDQLAFDGLHRIQRNADND
ncbi:hypothetical protein D3C81_1073180 [compost metagenome]